MIRSRLLVACLQVACMTAFHSTTSSSQRWRSSPLRVTSLETAPTETDCIVIGSGLAGLSCAALLAFSGYSVTVKQSHTRLLNNSLLTLLTLSFLTSFPRCSSPMMPLVDVHMGGKGWDIISNLDLAYTPDSASTNHPIL